MPEWKQEILRRLAPLKLSSTREAEIADELAQHLDDRYHELIATGQPLSPANGFDVRHLFFPAVSRHIEKNDAPKPKDKDKTLVSILNL